MRIYGKNHNQINTSIKLPLFIKIIMNNKIQLKFEKDFK